MTQAQLLADTFDAARLLTNRNWGKIKSLSIDPTNRIPVGEKQLNSPLWIYAHLGWTENYLLRQCLGDESVKIPWLTTFKFGTDGVSNSTWPSIGEIEQDMAMLHRETMAFVSGFTDEDLNRDNPRNAEFIGRKDMRSVIQHAIRHEGMHCGQLSWLVKLGS